MARFHGFVMSSPFRNQIDRFLKGPFTDKQGNFNYREWVKVLRVNEENEEGQQLWWPCFSRVKANPPFVNLCLSLLIIRCFLSLACLGSYFRRSKSNDMTQKSFLLLHWRRMSFQISEARGVNHITNWTTPVCYCFNLATQVQSLRQHLHSFDLRVFKSLRTCWFMWVYVFASSCMCGILLNLGNILHPMNKW